MPRFGVFYVPPAHNPFYRLATSILGYDARRNNHVPEDNFIRKQLPDFDEKFVKRPSNHGIHCTIVAPQSCRYGDLNAISYDIERSLNCFNEATNFEIHAEPDFVSFWGKKQQIVVLKYKANPEMLMLHTLLVAQLKSYVLPEIDLPTQELPEEYHRINHFNYPFVFDAYTPHFTLLFPYTGDKHTELAETLESLFAHFKKQVVNSICLMVQPDRQSKWEVYREYMRSDYPQAIE